MSKFPSPNHVEDLLNSLHDSTEIDDEGVLTYDKTLFEKHLPEECTIEQFEKMEAYRSDFINAAMLVGGELANEKFKSNIEIPLVSGGFSLGGSTQAVFTSLRETEIGGEKIYGAPRVVVTHTLPDTTDFAIGVRDHLTSQAKRLLAD